MKNARTHFFHCLLFGSRFTLYGNRKCCGIGVHCRANRQIFEIPKRSKSRRNKNRHFDERKEKKPRKLINLLSQRTCVSVCVCGKRFSRSRTASMLWSQGRHADNVVIT